MENLRQGGSLQLMGFRGFDACCKVELLIGESTSPGFGSRLDHAANWGHSPHRFSEIKPF
jgi:hypothetical protein